MSEKEKIVAILMEALNQATKNRLRGIRFSTRVQVFKINERLELIRKEIDEKIILFNSMNLESQSYQHIVKNAKSALLNLREKNWSFYCYELINNFLNLTDVFKKNKLKFIGIREVEEKVVKNPIDKIYIETPNIQKTEKSTTYINEGVRGKDIIKAKEEEIKIENIVQYIDL